MLSMQENEQSHKGQRQSRWPLFLSGLFILAIVLSYFFIPEVKAFMQEAWEVLSSGDEDRISGWIDQFGWWGPFIIVLSMIAQMFLLVVPTVLLMVVAVIAYGPFAGVGIILLAIFAASTTAYFLGAFLGTPVIEKLLGTKSKKTMEGFIDDYGFWAVIITRLSPFLSNDAISFVGGMLHMGYWKFIGATMLGIFPLASLIAYLGENNDRLVNGLIWVSVGSFIGLFFYVWWDKRQN